MSFLLGSVISSTVSGNGSCLTSFIDVRSEIDRDLSVIISAIRVVTIELEIFRVVSIELEILAVLR